MHNSRESSHMDLAPCARAGSDSWPHMLLQELQIYLDYKSDESYTPCKLAIRAGTSFHDLKVHCNKLAHVTAQQQCRVICCGCRFLYVSLDSSCISNMCMRMDLQRLLTALPVMLLTQEIKVLELKEPTGWTNVSLMQDGQHQEPEPLKAFFVQVM